MFTRNGKSLTAKGVKPICPSHQVYKTLYLFGAFSPITGEKFMLEMPFCNADTVQIFLNELSVQKANVFNIVVLDNAAFHKAKSLIIPNNIGLIFLPPYSPELNPAEKVWQVLKEKFSGKIHHSLQQVSEFITKSIKILDKKFICSLCGFPYIFEGINWTI